ncbi:MAG: PBP1A family penicillin-binding protein [Bdellovibrionales bacterium]|nr:PBP1A family penicillin-binding protein [Bdellovibrionales bacterium]
MGGILKTLIKWGFLAAIVGSILVTIVGGGAFWYFSRSLPDIITVADYRPAIVSQVVATQGTPAVIGEFYKERRYLIPYEKIPEKLVQAFISAEDDQFFTHQGVNLASILRAAFANFRAGHVVQGGSTITQQVAKSLLLTPERSFVRKAKELILANQIERNLTKQQILYLYLNQIYLGHGSYGVQAAAKVYFDKDVSNLDVAECAMIAGMPQAPGKYSPHLNPKKAKDRQLYVLRRMYENRYLKQDEYEEAAKEKLKVHGEFDVNTKYSPYYIETLRRMLVEKYGDRAVYEDGLQVTVDIDPELMKSAGKSVREGLRAIDRRNGFRGPVKKLKTDEEISKWVADARIKLVIDELGYDVLLPDGVIDTLEAVKFAGLKSEADLLKVDEIYQGVVTSLDPKAKIAIVNVGSVKTELPVSELTWAKPGVTQPAQVLQRGDVVQVRVIKHDGKDGERVVVGLDQDTEIQGALFAMNAHTGQVLAVEGGFSFAKSEFNRALQAQRQMGSAFKPMIFSAALEKGYTPASIIVDAPIVYNDDESGKWKPANFEEKFYGDTTFRQALIKSRNIPTIKIVQDVGIPYVTEFGKRVGMPTAFPKDLSISLGSATISLAELTKAYAIFPRYGQKIEPIYFSMVKDRDGKLLEENTPKPVKSIPEIMKEVAAETVAPARTEAVAEARSPGEEAAPAPSPTPISSAPNLPTYPLRADPNQVLDPRIAFVASHLMKEVVSYGTGAGAKQLGRPAAGKTGTTNDYQDAWFMGFTANVVAGAWVGYDTNKQIGKGETGARAALPIWLDFMKEAVKNTPESDFEVPPGVVFASIHPQTGKLAPPNASYAIKEAFLEGTEPKESGSVGNGNAQPARSTGDFLKEDIE